MAKLLPSKSPSARVTPHPALEVRDVVEAIVAQLAADVRCLLAAARVNRLWADVTTGWLWRTPPGAALAHVYGSNGCSDSGGSGGGSRSAYYDSKVRHITVVGDNACGYSKIAARYSDLHGWRLPHVTQLTFVRPSSAMVAAALLQRVLAEQQPLVRLRELKWHDDSVAAADDVCALNDIISVLLRHAPGVSLRSLSLYTINAVPDPATLLALLNALPSLTAVELEGPTIADALDDTVMVYLALNPRLTHLRLEKRVALRLSPKLPVLVSILPRPAAATGIDAKIAARFRNTKPYRHVTSFGCGIAPRAVLPFAIMVSFLTSLDIMLYAGDFALALSVIAARLTLLRSLHIMFSSASDSASSSSSSSSSSSDAVTAADDDDANEMFLRARDFHRLSRLKRLRSLQLAAAPPPSPGEAGSNIPQWRHSHNIGGALDQATFGLLVGGLPELRCLRIALGSAMVLTHFSLRDAGDACRQLETLELRGSFRLWKLRPQGRPASWTMFPCLTRLELSEVYTEYDASFLPLFTISVSPPPPCSYSPLTLTPSLFPICLPPPPPLPLAAIASFRE